ncbi:MAG: lactate utilization protein [Desulfobacterales bacterium]|nr:lactate utilization protein [Desulfobacterales bacterium]
MDETKKLSDALRWHNEKRIRETLAAIKRNNMSGIYVKSREAALKEILLRIPKGASVSHGGSRTLKELGIDEFLNKGGYEYLLANASWDVGTRESRLRDFGCDVFLTSVNAITLRGELIALDGFGNRAACLLFGPRKLLVIAGKNKIVETLEDGIKRIKDYVAPVHARRRGQNLPCAKAGRCVDCRSPVRICNKLAVLQYERDSDRTTVILVGEDLGI